MVTHNAVQIILAGFETTRNAFSGGVLALLENPRQMALLREDPRRLRLAAEEMVRWSDPVISLMRVATCDTELGGRQIRENERVMLWVPSLSEEDVMVIVPPAQTPVPTKVTPSNRLTVVPVSQPISNVGVLSAVLLSLLEEPVSLAP